MTDITYTYEIIAVDEAARSMEIVYTSEKYGVMHVGARLPFEGEVVEQVVAMFAPAREWRLRDLAVVVPEVGTSGELTDIDLAAVLSMDEQSSGQIEPLWSDEDEAAFEAQINAENSAQL
jgi:hypothetical protein